MEYFKKVSKRVDELESIIGKEVCKEVLSFREKVKIEGARLFLIYPAVLSVAALVEGIMFGPQSNYKNFYEIVSISAGVSLMLQFPLAMPLFYFYFGEKHYRKKINAFINKFPEKSKYLIGEYVDSDAKLNAMAFGLAMAIKF